MYQTLNIILLIFLTVLATGCGGGSDYPPLAKVSGKVLFDGKPLSGATVYYWPIKGGRTSTGLTDDNGHYQMDYGAGSGGVTIGLCQVRIEAAREKVTDDQGKVLVEARKEFIPAKYNNKTTLQQDVKQGDNIFDIFCIFNCIPLYTILSLYVIAQI